MSFEKTFCSSPWFHMRITNSGTYEPCRWMTKLSGTRVNFERNIKNVSPLTYFQTEMSSIRTELLQGNTPTICHDCHVMEQYGKPSGRQRQLLKSGVMQEYFEKSLASSPMRLSFDYSNQNQGHTTHTITDWQIDLGNYCNGSCVFCSPESSSTLATEFKKLGLIDQLPPTSWCDDPVLLDQFVDNLVGSSSLQYLHFLGGETLITPGFKKILSALVTAGLANQITIGFTTNLTVWSDSVVELLKQFQQVNLGMSIETLTAINDYVRYPSQQLRTKELLDRWVKLATQHDWLVQLRVTPTCLTVHDLTTVYDYAWQNNTTVESCNFIDQPEFLRIGVLPDVVRGQIAQELKIWIDNYAVNDTAQIVNTRDSNLARVQIVQDAASYLNYLETAPDESDKLPDLVAYLKRLESSRGNSVLTYLPQYEDLFRSNGY
jgi:sulfatase maturation enzyme AslB (radical SAM superfamily)